MKQTKLISIVMATYNGEKYIKTQLDSIINQTYKNIEIIIVDDLSNDNTVEIVKNYISRYKNIRLYVNPKNLGYIKNFEKGSKKTTGDFIAFSDQDDFWMPRKLERLATEIGNYDVIYCNSELVDKKLNSLNKKLSTNHNFISSKNPINFMIKNCVSGHAMLIKKELLHNCFDFSDLIPHDWWVTFIASTKNGVCFLNETLVKYRIHNDNVFAGDGYGKKNKTVKNIERKHRIKYFYKVLPENTVLRRINESYQNNSIYNRLKRVIVFRSNLNDLFLISDRPYYKKLFYCFSMFFKIR
jgi:glycosyltransferase involved in cell wall biosynthesis